MTNTTPETAIAQEAAKVIETAFWTACDAGWLAEADDLKSDWLRAGTDLRELLIVRDCAESLLAQLEANR